jgi:hypothetical protein
MIIKALKSQAWSLGSKGDMSSMNPQGLEELACHRWVQKATCSPLVQ